ncbi:hypothetical protein VEZ01S_19_01370 [Vibrio ezurae NBRC 102218]|uniref:Uncharacterized protein n=1 Tax=Vibrio ezurae NBRC 102218 TaxID=1219080 RepID=U3B2P2_9VIBR|nr:hypothetical protein VEZ01S_19_01370 [Vibrio ezurae NBRC 102218]
MNSPGKEWICQNDCVVSGLAKWIAIWLNFLIESVIWIGLFEFIEFNVSMKCKTLYATKCAIKGATEHVAECVMR